MMEVLLLEVMDKSMLFDFGQLRFFQVAEVVLFREKKTYFGQLRCKSVWLDLLICLMIMLLVCRLRFSCVLV